GYCSPRVEPFCPPQYDLWNCWPATPPNTTVYRPCPLMTTTDVADVYGFRYCQANGTWEHGNWTNYTVCLEYLDNTHRISRILKSQ
ncbi:hypothetical protein BaRGS_00037030, partial [Batillaria attramentaria]